ncbi:MAG: TatD family hydrolase [Planctomycetota bacterium]|nr:TatD family hydrolase [Planctomycetota bacterium]
MITDTHAHIFWDGLREDVEGVLERSRAAGVSRIVVVGTDVKSSHAAFELCRGRAMLHPTAGMHPHEAQDFDAVAQAEIERLCRSAECVAVGETGMDHFKSFSPRADQLRGFAWHAELAREIEKPLIVHSRDAHQDTLDVLRAVPGVRGVMHCWTMGLEELPHYLDLGFHISFSGVVTYPKNEQIRASARAVPADRIVFETDCPFLAPQKHRGKWPNEPALVRETLEFVAELRNEDADALAVASSANARTLFRLGHP